MSVAPNSGIIDFSTFFSPSGGQDGIQGQVPAPLSSQVGYVLTTSGWAQIDALPSQTGNAGKYLSTDGVDAFWATLSSTAAIGYTIDGDGDVITTGELKPGLQIPFAATIESVTLLADQTGSIVVDIWKDTYANYPPTVADSICGSAKPTLSSAIKSEDTTLTGWTKTIAAGDILLFNVDSATTVQRVTLILKVTKT